MPLNPSEPPHCSPTVSAESGAGVRWTRLASARRRTVWSRAWSKQRAFAAGLLLIEDEDRLGDLRIELAQLFHQLSRLRHLAAEAEHGGAGNVGVVNVAGEQGAKRLRVLAVPPQPKV